MFPYRARIPNIRGIIQRNCVKSGNGGGQGTERRIASSATPVHSIRHSRFWNPYIQKLLASLGSLRHYSPSIRNGRFWNPYIQKLPCSLGLLRRISPTGRRLRAPHWRVPTFALAMTESRSCKVAARIAMAESRLRNCRNGNDRERNQGGWRQVGYRVVRRVSRSWKLWMTGPGHWGAGSKPWGIWRRIWTQKMPRFWAPASFSGRSST